MDADKEYLADANTAQKQISEIIDRFGIVGFCDICSVECEQRKMTGPLKHSGTTIIESFCSHPSINISWNKHAKK